MDPIILKKGEKLSLDMAKTLFADITADEQLFEMETYGPWSIISKLKGLALRQDFDTGEIRIYGYRTMSRPRSAGYHMEGWVSIKGKKQSAFTSSHLFELENGHLIDVSIIFVREKK